MHHMEEQGIKALLEKYKSGTITDEEKAILDKWYLHVSADSFEELADEERLETFDSVLAHLNQLTDQRKTHALWKRIAAVASVILFLSIGGYFLLHKKQPVQSTIAQVQQHDFAPGRNKATLILANGQRIVLTKGLNGKLAQQNNATINVNAGNAIAYNVITTETNTTVEYNSLTTGRGEQSPYPLILADGTKVWLNAASSITFPTAFNDNDRIVKITGEAYFEVVHNAAHPFKVMFKGQTVEDVGTIFNINAYDDEPTLKTTLVEGSIKVSNTAQSLLLTPGQVAINKAGQSTIRISTANIAEATAWRHGLFKFNKTDIRTVMRQIARWYNVDVKYEGALPTKTLTGEIYRSVNASEALQILQYADVKFRIDNKTIIIKPKY